MIDFTEQAWQLVRRWKERFRVSRIAPVSDFEFAKLEEDIASFAAEAATAALRDVYDCDKCDLCEDHHE